MMLTALRPLARLAGSHRVVQAYLRGNGQPAASDGERLPGSRREAPSARANARGMNTRRSFPVSSTPVGQ